MTANETTPAEHRRPSVIFCGGSPPLAPTSMHRRSLSPNSEAVSRSSFSSVRENDDGFAQTFTRSKFSSYTEGAEEAIVDESPVSDVAPRLTYQPSITRPNSKLLGFWYPSNAFKGWREIPVSGKLASRSCENLTRLHMTWDASVGTSVVVEKPRPTRYPVGASPLETLPNEILGAIIDLLFVEIPPNGLTPRNADLMSLLLVSRSLHATTLTTLYRHITIPHSRIFRKFLDTISRFPALATIVRRLDFSHFNPSMLFRSASERAQTKNLTSETLLQCLELTPYLQEFLAQEYLDDDLSPKVLRKLLFHSPRLQALDLCGCSSPAFKKSLLALLDEPWPQALSITRLSMHKVMSASLGFFQTLLPRLPRLTHLDVAGTHISGEALLSIPHTARLTHLNLAKCRNISTEAIMKFLLSHPAAQSLVYLSLATDSSGHLLLGKDDATRLLPKLPPTLRSLNLKGSQMDASHIPHLMRLVQSLEELGVGRGLTMTDIDCLFFKDKKPIPHNLKYLDVSNVDTLMSGAISLLTPDTAPLRVLELEERAYERAAKAKKSLDREGWTAKDFGRRYWLVRMNPDGTTRDDGARWWKHGAESWGMRKIPVATAEVGGMYGSFMFGRQL